MVQYCQQNCSRRALLAVALATWNPGSCHTYVQMTVMIIVSKLHSLHASQAAMHVAEHRSGTQEDAAFLLPRAQVLQHC